MIKEQAMYGPAKIFVRMRYFHELQPTAGNTPYSPIIKETANTTRANAAGTWSIPDLLAVRYIDLPLLGLDLTEVHAFEVKPSSQLSLPAAYEAVAQTRGAHYGSVMVHTGADREEPARTREVLAACEHFGLGFLMIWGGGTGTAVGGEIVKLPKRQNPFPEVVEAALANLLDKREQEQLRDWRRRGER